MMHHVRSVENVGLDQNDRWIFVPNPAYYLSLIFQTLSQPQKGQHLSSTMRDSVIDVPNNNDLETIITVRGMELVARSSIHSLRPPSIASASTSNGRDAYMWKLTDLRVQTTKLLTLTIPNF